MKLAKYIVLSVVAILLVACAPSAAPKTYTETISKMVKKHIAYPREAGNVAGRTILRIRIKREGSIYQYKIQTSSGNEVLDNAAVDALLRAAPFPSVPPEYSGELFEFLLPITFNAKRAAQ